jgi:hypothetical protein
VLDFKGDPMASRVSSLREEVTAVLAVANERDEVVVRIENPGGFVHEQGLAASQLLRIRSRGIPLTVAVDTMAASGGYLMACVASKIVAAPFAVVGSIGVVAQVPNFYRLLDRAGVDVEQFTGGQFKRTVTMFGRNTDDDRRKLTEEIQDTHALFKEFVAEHRPSLDLDVRRDRRALVRRPRAQPRPGGRADDQRRLPRRARAGGGRLRGRLLAAPHRPPRDGGRRPCRAARGEARPGVSQASGRLGADGGVRGRDAAQLAGLEVLERLHQLGAGVHDERPVRRDRLADRAAAEDVDVERRRPRLLPLGGRDRDRVTGPEDRELPGLQRPPLGPPSRRPDSA